MFFWDNGNDFGNDIVGVLDNYGIVDVDIFVLDFIFIVQCCIGYCDVVDKYWFELCYWCDGVGLVDLDVDVEYFGYCFFGWKFMGNGKMWCL